MYMSISDVRDVATAHVIAMESSRWVCASIETVLSSLDVAFNV